MTRIPTPSLPLKTSDSRNSEVQEETRDHAARRSKQHRESRISKQKKVKVRVRIYFTLTLTYALIRGLRSETAEV